MKKLLLSLATLTLCANADAQMSETKSDNEIIIKNSKIALKQDLTRGGAFIKLVYIHYKFLLCQKVGAKFKP